MSTSMHPDDLLDDDEDPTRPDAPTPKAHSLVAIAVEEIDRKIKKLTARRDRVGAELAAKFRRTRTDLCSWDVGLKPTDEVEMRVLSRMRELDEQVEALTNPGVETC